MVKTKRARSVRSRPSRLSPAGAPPARRFLWLLPAGIALVTALAFLPTTRYEFTDWDDTGYVTENSMIRDSSPSGIGALFKTFVEGNYHPLTMVSLAVDYRLWKLNPKGYHLTNVVLHVLATTAVFAFVLLLTGSAELSAITSLFFGIHPLHVESVAWVSGRKDCLYALFYMLSCIAYLLWLRKRGPGPLLYAAMLLSFVLSVLSKGMAVTLPVALLAIDLYLKRGWSPKLLLEKAPLFLIAILFGYLSIVAQTRQGAIQDLASYPFHERILFACYGISAYLIRAVAPVGLSAFYPYPLRTGEGLPLIYYLAPLGVLVLGAGIAWLARKDRVVLFGALFFLINVALVLQLFPVGSAVIADRYTYLSFVGVGLILAGACRLLARALPARLGRAALRAVLVAAFSLAFFATRARSEIWRNNITLWTDVLSHYPTLPLGYTKRARTYMLQGNNERARADVEKAVALNPNDDRALTMRGTLRFLQGDNAGALADLRKSVAIKSDEPVAWNSLGAVHLTLGVRDSAQADFTRAIERNPSFAAAYLNRALARAASPANALPDFDAAIRFQPDNARAYVWRSETRMRLGDAAGALQDARQAQALGYPVDHAYLEILTRRAAGAP
jgi:protein O-mannosyl-transferase